MAEIKVNMNPEFAKAHTWEECIGKPMRVKGFNETTQREEFYEGILVEWDDLEDGGVELTMQIQ